MRKLNLGIVAHVDAGKTSLTERLLFAAGVIGAVGSVDAGSTQTDTLALERQRGITIKSAVVSFTVGDVGVNLIDTPGHPEFIAEVERVLSVLDGAVLVISAVEGVQAQTRVLWRALRRLGIPTLLFVNKIDRGGARDGGVLAEITRRLTTAVIPMGTAHGLGTRGAAFTPHGPADAEFTARLADVLAERDDDLLAAYVRDPATVSYRRLRRLLARQAQRALVYPVFFGSAITGAGVDALRAGLAELLPAAAGDAAGPLSGTVFKVDRGPAGEKIAYVRLFSGTVRTRDRVRSGRQEAGRVTAISVYGSGRAAPASRACAGQIAQLWGLPGICVGDPLGERPGGPAHPHFAPPSLETVVVPDHPGDKGALHLALTQLAEQDPLISLRQDDTRQEIYLSLYGEVQKEVIGATLAADFGIGVTFAETTTICVERVTGTGEAAEMLSQPGNPFLAGIGLRVEPAPSGDGTQFRLGIERGSLPVPFRKATEDAVRATLCQGLHGWQVTGAVVTLTRSGYIPPQGKRGTAFDPSISSTAGDFRNLAPLVVMTALKQAGTAVHEPVHRFHLEIPADTLAPVLATLAQHRAVPRTQRQEGTACLIEGDIPAARVHAFSQKLPALTRGEGVLENAFGHYQPVRGSLPTRRRTDHNPLRRKEYLLHVMRRA